MKFTIPSITITLPTINFKEKLHTATSPDQPRTTLKQKLHAYTAPKSAPKFTEPTPTIQDEDIIFCEVCGHDYDAQDPCQQH